EVRVPDEMSFGYFSASPDGRKLAVTGTDSVSRQRGIWVRDLHADEWRRLPGTEGASSLFWSPDSRYVAFIVGETVKKIDTTGGPPETVTSVPTATTHLIPGTWNA